MKPSMIVITVLYIITLWQGCVFVAHDYKASVKDSLSTSDTLTALRPKPDSLVSDSSVGLIPDSSKALHLPEGSIDTKKVQPKDIVDFAQTLLGTPYQYASIDPAIGFDCSGFVTYVFTHFNIIVPRSSIDFTNVGKEVRAEES